MGFVYDFDSAALVLRQSKPIKFNGSWKVIKDALIKSGKIKEEAGVIQKVVSVNKAATATETAGETLSALCAMDVSESTVAGVTTTTLAPKAAITFTPKTVALCGVAGALGLDFGFRVGQNIANLYFGDDWDWHAPGIFDAAKDAIRTYVKADGTTYYDEETINAFSNRLNDIGAFEDGSIVIPESVNFSNFNTFNLQAFFDYYINNIDQSNTRWKDLLILIRRKVPIKDLGGYIELSIKAGGGDYFNVHIVSSNAKSITGNTPYLINSSLFPYINYYGYSGRILSHNIMTDHAYVYSIDCHVYSDKVNYRESEIFSNYSLSESIEYGTNITNIGTYTSGGLPDVSKQTNATVPSTFPLDIPQTYPNWQSNPIVRPEDSAITYPVVMPDTDVLEGTATKPQDVAQTGVNTDAENSKVIEEAITIVPEIAQDIEATADPTIDGGETPIPIIPAIGVQATGFVALYNPTQSQLSAFSQYLWSNDFIENFKKLFSNPMDAIIGLHLIYATPSRGNVAEIVCGYSHSGVMSNTVSSQYIEIDCGNIKVNRYFGNVLDYAPYTKLQVYLPFVGIVDLDTNEIMNGTLNIKYRIDVLTGSCLARIKITRGDYNAELYNFAGNCAVQLPISGGSYSGIIANAIGVAGSLGATIATGGAMAPVLVGSVVSSAVNSRTNVSHSGSLGSNAGALGIMKPYLIITRPKPSEANYFNEFYGRPSNKTVRLSSCSGYTRVKDVHIEKISSATDDELNEIETLLKEGVII